MIIKGMDCRQYFFLVLLAALLLHAASGAEASHYRFGHLTWEARPDISPTTVDFRLTVAARRTFYRGSDADRRPQIGDRINGGTLQFGDGSSASLELEVIASNPEEDWIIGVASQRNAPYDGFVRKTYSSPTRSDGQPWVVSNQVCCRIGGLRTAGTRFRVQAAVDLTDQLNSPVSNISPIITCGRGGLCAFSVPAVDPDGNGLGWRLATSSESRITRYAGPPHSTEPLTVDRETGVVTWQTDPNTTLGFYATSIQIEDLDGDGAVRNSVPVEFLINVQDFTDNDPPTFDVPPSPVPGETVTIPAGAALTLNIQASDPDVEDTVILNHVGLPQGAAFETAPGNPANGSFTWTPTDAQRGEHLVTFSAIDNRGRAAMPHPVRINVVDPGIRDVSVVAEINDDNIVILSDSFAREPTYVEQLDGVTRVEWFLPSLTPQDAESLDLSVDFQAPMAGERRLLTRSVALEYTDINDNRIRQELEPQYVGVLPSVFDVDVATQRPSYGPDETVNIASNLSNLSRFTANADLRLQVTDADGVVVQDLGTAAAADLASGETRLFEQFQFFTGTTYIGTYQVRASVLDEDQSVVAQAVTDFDIQVDDAVAITGRVTTDRTFYDVGDTVQVTDRIANTVPNMLANNLRVETTLRTPEGVVLWEEQATLQQLPPGSLRDLNYQVDLERAPAGVYTVKLEVYREDGSLAASDAVELAVRSTADTGAGLAGLLAAFPRPVLRTESLNLLAEVINSGNTAMRNLPLTLSIVDPLEGVVQAEWNSQLGELPLDESHTFQQPWDAVVPESGPHYVAVLATAIGDDALTLATTPLAVEEKLQHTVIPESRGRILSLIDCPRSLLGTDATCERPDELEFAIREPLALRPGDQVTAELYDQHGGLLDSEQSVVGRFDSRWQERADHGRSVALTQLDNGRIQVAVMGVIASSIAGGVRLSVIVDGSDGVRTFESGYVVPDCAAVNAVHHEDFTLVAAWGPDSADPHGTDDAPSLAQQRRYLETVLRSRGWSYTLVTSVRSFEQAFASGHYAAYGLFHERIKLPERLQQELVAAVDEGAGMLVGGRHDQRNGRLDAALGLNFRGRLPHVDGMDVSSDERFPGGEVRFQSSIKPLRASLDGATGLAEFQPRPRQGMATAIAHNLHGSGDAVYFGYDLLVEGAMDGGAFQDDLLIAGLETLLPDDQAERNPPGIAVRISNLGQAAAGELLLPATERVRILDAGPGRITADDGVHWRFHLEEGGNATLPLWLDHEAGAPEALHALLRITTAGGEMVDYGTVTIRIP